MVGKAALFQSPFWDSDCPDLQKKNISDRALSIHTQTAMINPSPAAPGYVLPLQIV